MKTDLFYRPGVNPQSMDPDISGDTALIFNTRGDVGLIGVIDGAWVKGFDKPEVVADIAEWSSCAIAEEIKEAYFNTDDASLSDIIGTALSEYALHVAELKEDVGYSVTPPAAFAGIDPLKIGPQSAFALAQVNPDGSIELAQVRDCLAVIEWSDGRMERLTPNQSEIVAAATRHMDRQHEGLGAYQSVAQEVILNGQWAEHRAEVAELARKAHKAAFFQLWQQTEAFLPAALSGKEGFALWRDTFDTLCLCQNSWFFLNNPDAPVIDIDGVGHMAFWAMFTGEESMLPLMFNRTLSPEELKGAAALWLMSDGAFKQGDKGTDLQAMQRLGPEKYYEEVLMQRFDNVKPGRKRYAEDRVPMDVTIIRHSLAS